MSGIFASCVLTALLLVVTWADHHHHHHQGELNDHQLSSPNADFAFALYKNLNAKAAPGDNIFFSPLGISTALSMLSTGACGETHSQLFSSLGYSSLNQTQVNEAYEHLFRMHGHTSENQQLDVGNAVALSSNLNPLEKFLNDVRHYYFGEILNTDFSKPGEAAAEINAYIANKTQDKIKDMVKNVDRETAMVLINYVYFRGQWKYPFENEQTHKADFHVNVTTKVEVDMMSRTGYYKTYLDPSRHTTVITLPYEGNTSMMIVLPNKGKMKEVEGYINKTYIKLWRDSATEKYVELRLPKFSISADASLDNTLKKMGITKAFENTADFRGISDKAKIKVSKASHKATLSITEMGTEAAATNIFELVFFTLPLSVTINRPFLVFILENPTESILFMGKINNPMAI
ncbi:alpha-1-antitrypsin homolog [Melanotaenia boesemani]|uniref:alpha-1-antitrypsin homolog n=1 Tax=Melanotaenia boesemani TaxID=1250792 RepID=UPI001C05CFA5|nr:alpha-1-antitrypsin homolog [Melanotaenia boesemani]